MDVFGHQGYRATLLNFPKKEKSQRLHSPWLIGHSVHKNQKHAFGIQCVLAKLFLAEHLFQPNKEISYK
jgi:hypothetical protein